MPAQHPFTPQRRIRMEGIELNGDVIVTPTYTGPDRRKAGA